MKTKIFRLSHVITILLILIVSLTCKKDEIITESNPNLEEVHYENAEGTGKIGKAGGSITIVNSGSQLDGVGVIIPSGALDKVEEIKISLAPSDIKFPADETVDIISFEPAGLEFQKEIEILLPYKASDTTNLAVIYFDSDSIKITEMPKTRINIENKTISAGTDHFSYYTVWDKDFRLEVKMLNIEGNIGARFKIAGRYVSQDGLRWIRTTLWQQLNYCLTKKLHL